MPYNYLRRGARERRPSRRWMWKWITWMKVSKSGGKQLRYHFNPYPLLPKWLLHSLSLLIEQATTTTSLGILRQDSPPKLNQVMWGSSFTQTQPKSSTSPVGTRGAHTSSISIHPTFKPLRQLPMTHTKTLRCFSAHTQLKVVTTWSGRTHKPYC